MGQRFSIFLLEEPLQIHSPSLAYYIANRAHGSAIQHFSTRGVFSDTLPSPPACYIANWAYGSTIQYPSAQRVSFDTVLCSYGHIKIFYKIFFSCSFIWSFSISMSCSASSGICKLGFSGSQLLPPLGT